MRAVLDSNVLISGFLFRDRGGVPAHILTRLAQGAFAHVTCTAILDEVQEVLVREPDVMARYNCTPEVVALWRAGLEATSVRADPRPPFPRVSRDPEDDVVLACAVLGAAAYLVSGDNDLVSLGEYKAVRILTPREFLTLLEGGGRGQQTPASGKPHAPID